MELKEYSMEQLDKLLEEMKRNMQQMQNTMENCQSYIKSHEEQIQVAQNMIEDTRETFETVSGQVQEILKEIEQRQSYSSSLFPIEEVHLMCFRKKSDTAQNQQTYTRGLVPYLARKEKILVEFKAKEENGELKQTPVYEEKEVFSMNPEGIQYELEECTLTIQNTSHSVLFPGVELKDIIQDMKEKEYPLVLGNAPLVGYEEIREIAQYAYDNWEAKKGWRTGREDFFQTENKVKKLKI